MQQHVGSMNPDAMVEGSGLFSGPAMVAKSVFGLFTYPGTNVQGFGLLWTLLDDAGFQIGDGPQFYSFGKPTEWTASPDGKQALSMSATAAFTKSSNGAFLVSELINIGFPPQSIGGDASVYEGMYAMFEPKPQPKRQGLPETRVPANPGEQARERMAIVPTVILALPWDTNPQNPWPGPAATLAAVQAGQAAPRNPAAGGAAAAGVAVATPTAAPVAAGAPVMGAAPVTAPTPAAPVAATAPTPTPAVPAASGDQQSIALGLVKKAVDAGGGVTQRQALAQLVFTDLAADAANRDPVAALIFAPTFAANLAAGGYVLEGETIKAA